MVKSFKNIASPDMLWGNTIENMTEIVSNPRRITIDMLRLFVGAKVPVILHGPPGSAKSETIKSMSKITDEEGRPYNVVVIIPSSTDPTVLNGIMYTFTGSDGVTVMKRSLPDTAVAIEKKWVEERRLTILLLDEISTALISQQHALLNFLTTGEWGDLDISDKIAIVMASNPKGTVMVSRELDMQFLNRAGHLPWYSQPDYYLSGFKTGFGNPSKAPSPQSVRELEGMFATQPDQVFRSTKGAWKIDNLVPYDNLELSERTASLYAQVSGLIDEVSGVKYSVNPVIRWEYKRRAAQALFGNIWGKRMSTVLNNESKRKITSEEILAMSNVVSFDMSIDDVKTNFGNQVYASGTGLSSAEVKTIFQDMVSSLQKDNESGMIESDKYCIVWAFVSSTPRESDYGIFIADLTSILVIGKSLATRGILTKEQIVPNFVPSELKEMLRQLLSVG